jgi:hypothetical protein
MGRVVLPDMAAEASSESPFSRERHICELDPASFLKFRHYVRGGLQTWRDHLPNIPLSQFSIADIWLHFSMTTMPLYAMYSVADHQGLKPNIAINSTLCAGASTNTCVFDGTAYAGPAAISDIGNVVAANASATFQVHTFSTAERELTAVIVPTEGILPRGMSFQSTSYGVGATCAAASCDPTWFQNGTWSATLGATSLGCTVNGAVGQSPNASLVRIQNVRALPKFRIIPTHTAIVRITVLTPRMLASFSITNFMTTVMYSVAI